MWPWSPASACLPKVVAPAIAHRQRRHLSCPPHCSTARPRHSHYRTAPLTVQSLAPYCLGFPRPLRDRPPVLHAQESGCGDEAPHTLSPLKKGAPVLDAQPRDAQRPLIAPRIAGVGQRVDCHGARGGVHTHAVGPAIVLPVLQGSAGCVMHRGAECCYWHRLMCWTAGGPHLMGLCKLQPLVHGSAAGERTCVWWSVACFLLTFS